MILITGPLYSGKREYACALLGCGPEELAGRLAALGYTRCQQVEGVGQFALRGGILDVFSPLMAEPVRCEFFDDEVDSLGSFDVISQRRTKNLESALLLPAVIGESGIFYAEIMAWIGADVILISSYFVTIRKTERMFGR